MGMKLVSPVAVNPTTVFITLETDPVFTFASEAEMKTFIQYRPD